MKKVLLISLFVLSISILGRAQSATQARKVLDRTAAVVGAKSGASANFSISSAKFGGTSGVIAIKGNKFYARTPKAIMWFNGKTQWTYMHSTNEVNISNPNAAKQMTMNPYTFINLYRSGYNLSMKSVGNNYLVHLTAQNAKQSSIKEVYITINKRDYKPSQVKMVQNGVLTTINISNFRTKSLSDNIFTFNSKDYPKAEIIDLR